MSELLHDDGKGLFFHQVNNLLHPSNLEEAGRKCDWMDRLKLQLMAALVDGVRELTTELKIHYAIYHPPTIVKVKADYDSGDLQS